MIKYFLTLLICIQVLFTEAQKNVTVGKPYDVVDADTKLYFTDHGEILTVKIKKKTIILQKLDAVTLALQKMKLYDDFPKNYRIEKITSIRNRYFVFYSLSDGDDSQLFYREIDFANGSFVGGGKKLFSVAEKKMSFEFQFSYDLSSTLILYGLDPEVGSDGKKYGVIGVRVFDPNLNEQWKGSLRMPYTWKKMENLDWSVDGKGNVYVVAKVYDDNSDQDKRNKDGDTNYHLEILKGARTTGAITSSKIDVNNNFIQSISLYESSKGYMMGGGFYNKGKDRNNVDGIIFFKLGSDGKVFDMVTHEIPLEILNQNESRRTQRKNERKDDKDKAEFANLDLKTIAVQEDGSVIMVAEQNYTVTHTTTTSTGGRTSYTYYYSSDMLVTKIAASGKLAWMKKLPKLQMSGRGLEGMSHHYFRGKNEHYLMYLDNEKNLDLKPTEEPATHVDGKGGFLTAYKINDETGVITKILLLDTRDVHGIEVFQFDPDRMMATAPATIVFEAYKKKKEDILVKILLE